MKIELIEFEWNRAEQLLLPAGAQHAREGADGAPPGGEPQEGQPLRRGARLGAEQHPRQGHRQGHRRAPLGELPSVPRERDRGRSHVTCSCVVQGREGEIRHLFRGFAFLHCKKLVENGGMFVCKTRHLVLAGGSKVSAASPLTPDS